MEKNLNEWQVCILHIYVQTSYGSVFLTNSMTSLLMVDWACQKSITQSIKTLRIQSSSMIVSLTTSIFI